MPENAQQPQPRYSTSYAANGSLRVECRDLSTRDFQAVRDFCAAENLNIVMNGMSRYLTNMCWKKCITGPIRTGELERGEESCLKNCVTAFWQVGFFPNETELRKFASGR